MEEKAHINLEIYRRMMRIRRFEEAVEKLWDAGEVPGYCHSSVGQEAAVVGACMALRDDDYITGTHRSHAHPIGKGAKLNTLMAELLGKETGICKGRGGSMHFADSSVGAVGESAIVGGGIPLATGAGLSAHVKGSDRVSLCFFGDGAVNQGAFHESINMAAIWKLPVIYFCENNFYAISTRLDLSHGQPEIAKRADGYGVPGVSVDGQDANAVKEITIEAVSRARQGGGPTLIEAKTYRFDEHNIGLSIQNEYRSEGEVEQHKVLRDPIKLFKNHLLTSGIAPADIWAIDDEVEKTINDAITFARESHLPHSSDVYAYMYSNPINYPPREF